MPVTAPKPLEAARGPLIFMACLSARPRWRLRVQGTRSESRNSFAHDGDPGGLRKAWPRITARTRERVRARTRAWDAERVAAVLVPRRDRLVEQLPRELAAARGLSRDQCELVIDEAIDFMVTEYAKPITDREFLERAFWATASFRVKRVHEGRGATVRAGWQRVDVDAVEHRLA